MNQNTSSKKKKKNLSQTWQSNNKSSENAGKNTSIEEQITKIMEEQNKLKNTIQPQKRVKGWN